MKRNISLSLLCCVIVLPVLSVSISATSFDNSLWIGNDNVASLGILNTDLSGNVLQTIANTSAMGFGFDPATDILYVNENFTSVTKINLNTMKVLGSFTIPKSEDMSFIRAGIFGTLWVTDVDNNSIDAINATTGKVFREIPTPACTSNPCLVGLAVSPADGSFWISHSADGNVLHLDENGNQLAWYSVSSSPVGGVAVLPDGTVLFGEKGAVYQLDPASGNVTLDFRTGDQRFIDGLEYQGVSTGVVPEPSTFVLLGSALLGLGGLARKRMQKA